MVLIGADLVDAKRDMTIFDRNEDGFIDAKEQQRLSWKKEVTRFDLNKDGKLTHLELAVRQASLRSQSDVTQFDRNNARTWMSRKDGNGNGQLDPEEIALGWPRPPEDFDTDKNGVITIAELAVQFAFRRSMRREMGIEAVDQTEALRLRDQYDSNKDGMLAADEWAAASLPRDGKEFDEDGDKRLSLMELATLLAKHRMELGLTTADQSQARQLVRMMDMNQDGKISREESQRAEGFGVQRSELGDYDANKDGNITLAEVENVLARQRKEKGYNATHFSEAQKILLRLDRNRSNYLESDELADEPGPGELPANQFKVIDLDDDQRLDIDELARHLAKEEK